MINSSARADMPSDLRSSANHFGRSACDRAGRLLVFAPWKASAAIPSNCRPTVPDYRCCNSPQQSPMTERPRYDREGARRFPDAH